jgi:hypothetical protein
VSEPTLEEKVEALAQQLVRYGMSIAKARALLQEVIFAPPTEDEIAEAIKELQEPRQ